MSEPKKPGLLTVKEVAEQWRVSEKTVRRWIDKGAVEVVRKGGVVRVPSHAAGTTTSAA